jgi:DNA recombination protein RmuC
MATIEVVAPYLTFSIGIVLGLLIAAFWMQRRLTSSESRAAAESVRAEAAEKRAVSAESRAAAAEGRSRELAELGTVEARVTGVVAPLAETIERLQKQVREFESGRQRAFGSIESQLQTLSRETVALSNTLRAPQGRGRWGELTLRRVVELAGMAAQCDFYEQESLTSGNGRSRPDMLIRLPGGRIIAVDAKAPLGAFQEAIGAADDTARKSALTRHSQLVARHVDQLAAKQYWAQIQPSPELVVLFLPGDHFLTAALEGNPALLENAIAQKVVLATPSTLISALAGVAHGWRQQQVIENAELIRQTASDVYERLLTWQGYYADMGGALERAVHSYNRSVASWESRLVPSMRRIREMGAAAGPEPAAPEPVDTAPRVAKVMEAHNPT